VRGTVAIASGLAATAMTLLPPGCVLGRSQETVGEVVWNADASKPLAREWASICTETDGITTTRRGMRSERIVQVADETSPSPTGRTYRVEIRANDHCGGGERAEVGQGDPEKSGMNNRLFREGDERWISWSMRLGGQWNMDASGWQIIAQWKQTHSRGGKTGSPVVAFAVTGGRWTLVHRSATEVPSRIRVWHVPFARVELDRWVRISVHVRFSQDPRRGFIEVFGDMNDGRGPRTLVSRRMASTLKRDDVGGNEASIASHARYGIYRHPAYSEVSRVEFAGLTVATTRAAAEAHAFG
jgi:hypothetical protein